MAVQLKRRLFTVEEYYKMAEAGILTPESKVELINGEIIRMSPSKSEHANAINLLVRELIIAIQKKAMVSVQNPISVNEHSEPEPDIAILRQKQGKGYRSHHPRPEDILLIIEVSDSSLNFDREVKMPLYAEAGIPEYWIINLQDQQVEIYKNLVRGQYSNRRILFAEDQLTLEAFDWSLPITELF